MFRIGTTIIKLALSCLVVGLILAFFRISPRQLVDNFEGTVREIFAIGASMLEWAGPYILLGAVVVVPVWLVLAVVRPARNRGEP